MTVVEDIHAERGATFGERGGHRIVQHYGHPKPTVNAVRSGVGVIEMEYGMVAVSGEDRIEYVDNVVSNRVPPSDGEGCYTLYLDSHGGIETDMYMYNDGERLVLFTPPDQAAPLVEEWSEKIFIEDVELEVESDTVGVFGVHGPRATESVATVVTGGSPPESPLTFVRGSIGEADVTVAATDAPVGEEGFEVICSAEDAPGVFDRLLSSHEETVPFGYDTWEVLTTEAGVPLFETELAGEIPNLFGLRNAVDFEKGNFVGYEVVSRVENRGRPSRRLIGLRPDERPESGASVLDGDSTVGEITRSVESPSVGEPIALALVTYDLEAQTLHVETDEGTVEASRTELPFVDGSQHSSRVPTYPGSGPD